MKVLDFIIRSNEQLNDQNNLLKVAPTDHKPLCDMYPGQFVQILVDNSPYVFLRRPISINYIDKANNEMWLLIQRVGEGTEKICEKSVGDVINLIYPLGNNFSLPDYNGKLLLIGGGVGTAPMLFLGSYLKTNGLEPEFLLGGKSKKDILQLTDFEQYGNVYITTEDGSAGEQGYVTDHSVLQKNRYDYIYTCGPKPMMLAVARYAHKNNIDCEVSLENLMACGFGACLCCTEKTVRGNVCSCTEGPVFHINELTWIN